jgi:hypothetical protein
LRISDLEARSEETRERERIKDIGMVKCMSFMKYFLHYKFSVAIFPYFFLK